MFETKSTTVPITKVMVKEAYRKVKSNQGSAGVDEESLEKFESDLLTKKDFHFNPSRNYNFISEFTFQFYI